jgi:hypothetical protein
MPRQQTLSKAKKVGQHVDQRRIALQRTTLRSFISSAHAKVNPSWPSASAWLLLAKVAA